MSEKDKVVKTDNINKNTTNNDINKVKLDTMSVDDENYQLY